MIRLLPLLLMVVLAIYWPGLSGAFVFDDYGSIVNNPSLRLFDGSLPSLVESSTAGGVVSPLGRPLSLASFAANLYFLGDAPFYFKLVNLLIHLADGLLVYVLVRQIWPHLIRDERAGIAAFWIAALWLLHPINLTPVLFVVQRMTGLAALFTLAALCLYLYGRESAGYRRWLALGISLLFFWPAGILSKETALILPLIILLCEWLVLDSFYAWTTRNRRIGFAVSACIGLGLMMASWPLIESTYLIRTFTPAERLLTESRVLWLYVGQMLLPWPDLFSLHHDDISISNSLFDPPATALAILGWMFAIGVALLQRLRRPWIAFSVFWFLAGQVLESSIIGLEIAYEHRNYLPSIAVFFGLAVLLIPSPAVSSGKMPRYVLAFGFIALCGLVTGLRAAQWGDEYIRTQIEANTHPKSARTNYEAARAILARMLPTGFMSPAAYHMAHFHFQRAAELDPQSKAAPAGILYLDCASGMKKDVEVQMELLGRLANERFTFGDQMFVQGLSNMLVNNLLCMDEREVEALIAAALSNPTAQGKIRGMLYAVAMDYAAAKLGSLSQARIHAVAAVESDPGNAVLRINLIRVLLHMGNSDEAKRQYAILQNLQIPAASRKEVENLKIGLDH